MDGGTLCYDSLYFKNKHVRSVHFHVLDRTQWDYITLYTSVLDHTEAIVYEAVTKGECIQNFQNIFLCPRH